MRPAPSAVLLAAALALAGCAGGSDPEAAPAREVEAGYSQEVRTNFLDSCLANATNTSNGAATPEQLRQTCACILGKVEQEYSQAQFADFEKRLLGGQASEQESGRLTTWSSDCARTAAG